MSDHMFIAGDWGTSSCRLHLCKQDTIIDSKSGPGISKLSCTPAETLFSAIDPWTQEYGKVPIYLAGMVGSNIGWITTPYVPCPVGKDEVRGALTHLKYMDHDIHIAGGISCTNPLGSPDVMRGEETQIFGALALYESLQAGKHFLCLPGTHTKWVTLQDSRVETFHTALTGELYDLLLKHSVLVKDSPTSPAFCEAAFREGALRSLQIEDVALLHSLFEVRSKQIDGALAPEKASAYMSGLIIGRDVAGACRIFQHSAQQKPITVIGAPHLTQAYRTAIELYGGTAIEHDGSTTAIAGLKTMFQD